jgi:hypothetical protein
LSLNTFPLFSWFNYKDYMLGLADFSRIVQNDDCPADWIYALSLSRMNIMPNID